MGLYQDKLKMFGGNGMAVDRSAGLLPVTREVQEKTEQKKAQEKKKAEEKKARQRAAELAATGAKNDRKGFAQLEAPAKQDQLKSTKQGTQESGRPRFESKFRENWLHGTAEPLGVAENGGRIRFTPRNPAGDGKRDRPVFTPSTVSGKGTMGPGGAEPKKTGAIFGNPNFKRFESKVLDNANMQYPLITPKVKPQKMSGEEYLRRYIEKGRHSENNPLVTGGLHVSEFPEENKWYMDNLSDEEKAQINFLYGRYDKKEADKRARAVWAKKKEDFQDFIAQEGGAAGFMAKNRAVVKSVGAGMQYGVEKLGQNMKHKLFGIDEPIPEYSAGSLSIKSGERARNTFTKGDGGFVKTAKEIGLSVWDNASRVAMYGGAAPFVMALDVFGHATKDADERGATINQSMIYGLANGAAEFLGEKFSLKGLENIAKAGRTGIKNIIKFVGAQVAKEAGEEAATEVMNIISDAVIMSKNAGTGSQSNFDLYLKSYMENNPDKNKAAAVLGYAKESLIQIGMAGLAGGISGGILSGGARMIGNMRANSYIQDIQNDIDNAKNVIQENNSRIGSVQRDNSLDFSARNKRVSDLITANRAIQDYIQDQETTIQNVKQGTAQESRQKPVTHIDLVSAILREDSGKDGAARAYVNLQGMEDGNYRVTDVYGLETVKSAEVVNARYLPIDTTPAEDGIRYSIKDVGGRAVVVVDTDQGLFAGADPKEYNKIARSIISEKYSGKTIPLSNYNLTRLTHHGNSKYTNPKQDVEPDIFRAKMKASPELENLLKVSQYMGHAEDTKNHPFATQGWDYYKTRFIVDGVEFEGTVNIGLSDKGAYFYDINNIQRTGNLDIKNGTAEQLTQPPGVWPAASAELKAQGGSYNTTILQKNHDVNRYSMQNGEENARPVFRPGLGLESRERPVFTYEGSMKLLQDFSEKTGVKVILDRNLAKTEEGWYDSTNRELHINPNQAGRMNTLIKHEFTHILESSPYYVDLVEYVQRNLPEEWEAAQSLVRGIYAAENQRRTVSGETAIELTPARLSSETMAKLAEQFQTEEFIRDTCRKDPNMAQRFIRIIRDLIERIKEIFGKGYAKPWETAQRKWEKAFSDVVENGVEPYEAGQDSGRFAILDNPKGKYVQADTQVIKSGNQADWEREIIDYVNQTVRSGQDVNIPLDNGESITITGRTAWKLGDKGNYSDQLYLVKGNAAGVIDEIVQVSKYLESKEPKKQHRNNFAKNGFDYRRAYFRDLDGKYYILNLSVGINADGKEMYNIGRITEIPFPVSGSKAVGGSKAKGTVSHDTTIAQTKSDVNSYDMPNGKKYSFAGPRAKTADLAKLRQAEEMEAAGAAKESIFRETGWFRGAEGKWRFEIDDSGAKVRPVQAEQEQRLGDVLEHPALYAAYPELSDYPITAKSGVAGYSGRVTMDAQGRMNKGIDINGENLSGTPEMQSRIAQLKNTEAWKSLQEKRGAMTNREEITALYGDFFDNDPVGKALFPLLKAEQESRGWYGEDAKDVILHEIQHGIQDIEGFAKGASPTTWEKVLAMREQEAALKEAMRRSLPHDIGLGRTIAQIKAGKLPAGALEERFQSYLARYIEKHPDKKPLVDYAMNGLDQSKAILARLRGLFAQYGGDAESLYRRTAGEQEARDVQARMDMTAEQRRERFPNVPEDPAFIDEFLGFDKIPGVEMGGLDMAAAGENSGKSNAGKTLTEQIDRWNAEGRNPRIFFDLGKPSTALISAGIDGNNIHMDASKVLRILSEHPEMTLDVIKQLDSVIGDPIIVLKSKNQNAGNSFVVYGDIAGENGRPVMVAIRTGLKGGVNAIEDVSKITSAYTRRNTQNLLNSSEVRWINPDEKRTANWMYSFGLQLPSATSISDSLIDNSIPYSNTVVNSQDMQDGEKYAQNLEPAQEESSRPVFRPRPQNTEKTAERPVFRAREPKPEPAAERPVFRARQPKAQEESRPVFRPRFWEGK